MNKYLIFWVKCKHCSFRYEYLDALDGTQQLRHPKNMRDAVEVSWLEPFFKEIGNIVDSFLDDKGLKPIPKARVFSKVFGKLCDTAPDGAYYDMSGIHRCPKCGSSEVSGYGPTDPPLYWEGDLPQVKHTRWDCLSKVEKDLAVKKELKLLGC